MHTAGVDSFWAAHVALPEQRGWVRLGKSYWTAEAAARAADRAQLALYRRDNPELSFPLEWYGPEVSPASSQQLATSPTLVCARIR